MPRPWPSKVSSPWRLTLYRRERRPTAGCGLALTSTPRDFSAAVDFLGLKKEVDRNRIGIIGICGWGGMALNATAVDKRVKAVVASTMQRHDPRRVQGYNDSMTLAQRTKILEQLSQQRWQDAQTARQPTAAYNTPGGARRSFWWTITTTHRFLTKRGVLSREGGQLRSRMDTDHLLVYEYAAL